MLCQFFSKLQTVFFSTKTSDFPKQIIILKSFCDLKGSIWEDTLSSLIPAMWLFLILLPISWPQPKQLPDSYCHYLILQIHRCGGYCEISRWAPDHTSVFGSMFVYLNTSDIWFMSSDKFIIWIPWPLLLVKAAGHLLASYWQNLKA